VKKRRSSVQVGSTNTLSGSSAPDDIGSLPVESDKAAKLKGLKTKKAWLMEQIKFQKDLGEDYKDPYHEYLAVCNELNRLVAPSTTPTKSGIDD
jgi:hypothetical protein